MNRLTHDIQDISILISNYLCWIIDRNYTSDTIDIHKNTLHRFNTFISENNIEPHLIFDPEVLKKFYQDYHPKNGRMVMYEFILFLKKKNIVRSDMNGLCCVFSDYVNFYQRCGFAQHDQQKKIRNTLKAFNDFLERNKVSVNHLTIEIIDMFLSEKFKSKKSVKRGQSFLRGFLRYLYHEAGIGVKDLSPLLISAPVFARNDPPKFLRHNEIKNLLDSTSDLTDKDLRTNAIVRLALSTGMRPIEIANITLDDICFKTAHLKIPVRKSNNPIIIPLPDDTIKAIAAYIIGARPEINERILFLTLKPPHWPITSSNIQRLIRELMKKANVTGSAYSMRHTFAQNMLISISVFE